MIICGHFDDYRRFFLMIACGEAGAMLIICADFDDYLRYQWEFYDYSWGSRCNVDYMCRVWGLYVGILMIICGEASEM